MGCVKAGKRFKYRNIILGDDGFSYKRDESGKLVFNEHEFGVIIGNDVTMGVFSSIARGSWRDTVIGEGTKMDNYVHVAHNVIIGKHCLIGPHVSLLGSCEIGDYSTIWTGAIIHQRIKIGQKCVIGANSYIRHDVPDNHMAYVINGKQVMKKIDKS